MKKRGKFIAILAVGAIGYGALATILALPLLGNHGIAKPLRIDSLSSTVGVVGAPLQVTTNGSGFDRQTSFFLSLDSGNQQAILARSETFGATNRLLKEGDTLYLADLKNGKLLIYDIKHPEKPEPPQRPVYLRSPIALAFSAGTLWVATGTGTITSPGIPHYRLADIITDLASDMNGRLYAAAANDGLIILGPPHKNEPPQKIGSLKLPGSALSVAIEDNLAYVSSSQSGLHICDISNPEHPRLLSSLPWPGSNQRIASKKGLVLLASNDRIVLIDVRNPQNPLVLGQLATNRIFDVAISKDVAYLAAGNLGLLAIDISDPGHPRISGHLSPGDAIHCLAIDGKRAYLGTESAGLLVVDLNKVEANPEWRPRLNLSFISGNHVPIATALRQSGAACSTDSWADLTAQLPERCSANDAVDIGQTTYLGSDCGLFVIDRNEPSPLKVQQLPPGNATEMVLSENTLYISGSKQGSDQETSMPLRIKGEPGLQIYDVSEPQQPRARGFFATDDRIRGLNIQGDRAYLAVKDGGVLIVDLSNRDQPKLLGTASLPWPEQTFAGYFDVALHGTVLYVANGRAGLHVFDCSDPTQPKRIAAFNNPGSWLNSLTRDENQLFVYDQKKELQMYDITDPELPRLTGTLGRFVNARSISTDANSLQIGFANGFSITQALPLVATTVHLNGKTGAELSFPAPVFPGDYFLYAFNDQGQRKSPVAIHIEPAQK